MIHWYALYTKPRAERQVSDILTGRGLETFLPATRTWRARRRRFEQEPLFAGYLFARFDLRTTGFSAVAWTPGLRCIVSAGDGEPVTVPEPVIDFLKLRTEQLNSGDPPPRFRPGTAVRITSGPLKDLEAIFEQHLSRHERSRVLIQVLGRLARYQVPTGWLRERRSPGRR